MTHGPGTKNPKKSHKEFSYSGWLSLSRTVKERQRREEGAKTKSREPGVVPWSSDESNKLTDSVVPEAQTSCLMHKLGKLVMRSQRQKQ